MIDAPLPGEAEQGSAYNDEDHDPVQGSHENGSAAWPHAPQGRYRKERGGQRHHFARGCNTPQNAVPEGIDGCVAHAVRDEADGDHGNQDRGGGSATMQPDDHDGPQPDQQQVGNMAESAAGAGAGATNLTAQEKRNGYGEEKEAPTSPGPP